MGDSSATAVEPSLNCSVASALHRHLCPLTAGDGKTPFTLAFTPAREKELSSRAVEREIQRKAVLDLLATSGELRVREREREGGREEMVVWWELHKSETVSRQDRACLHIQTHLRR